MNRIFTQKLGFLLSLSFVVMTTPIFSIGTYAEGYVVGKILQFESRGIFFESYEGIMEISSFDPKESCDESKDQCFSPTVKQVEFSLKPENADTISLISKNVKQTLLMRYNIHRIEPLTISSEMEILEATVLTESKPAEVPARLVVGKTGGKRNFSVNGVVLQLDYQGTFIGTFEGLYRDEQRGKVHPFSVTNEQMARHIYNVMKTSSKTNLGVSVSYIEGFRKSDYDIFEVNFDGPASGNPK